MKSNRIFTLGALRILLTVWSTIKRIKELNLFRTNSWRFAITGLAAAALIIGVQAGPHVVSAAADRPFNTWHEHLGGADSSQYSSLRQINKSNVKQLQIAWTYSTGEGSYLFNPIVIDGVMYVQAKSNSLVALDALTGKELWVHPFQGPVVQRGINYWESKDRSDRRLLTINGGFLTAIDAQNGQTISTFGDNGRADLRPGLDFDWSKIAPIHTNNPGRIFEDIMIVPLMRSGSDYAYVPGDIHAYSVRTGKLLWQFHTIPRPGEAGYDTWPPDFWQRSGGGINWSELTIDEKRGIAYIPTGTGKWDFYGADRKGMNLFANSVIALDARTGKRLWHFQTVHHDLWDYDLPAGPKLLTIRHDGRNVDVVIQPSKQGFLYVLDRETGRPIWPMEERPVPKSDVPGEESWPTQPFPTRPPPFARQALTEKDVNPYIPAEEQALTRDRIRNARNEGLFTPPGFKGTVEIPGSNGGASWGTAAVDPAKGALYIVSHDQPNILILVPPDSPLAKGAPGTSAEGRGGRATPTPPRSREPEGAPFTHYAGPNQAFVSVSTRLPTISPPWFQMTAYDMNSGVIKWQVPYGTVPALAAEGHADTGVISSQRGGPVVTAGGLIFTATNDKKFRAWDKDTGKVIWETDLPAAAEGVPAVYEIGGREYIAVCAAQGNGPNVTLPGAAKPPTTPPQNSYVVFTLPK
ncbi:MAG TPA: pyrroloquinoline quinone-dependent dehydrogenase [Bryobacteraceae bacterium]|nr:pyrroloquinoline quinone-dependent dehydrogenase [Bryobacteraceae bacterium]